MDYTVIVPARMASSRLPDKPLADIAGVPMVVRVAQRAARSGAARVVVAADDARVLHACAVHGVQACSPARTTPAAATAWPRPASSWAWTARPASSMCRATSR